MSARKPRCSALVDNGKCMALAVQRVLPYPSPGQYLAGVIFHRCAEHKVTKAEAKRNKWSTFDITDER